jgi:MoCo/4Fe-4S cofactor protein with predicted Tat translocation signal
MDFNNQEIWVGVEDLTNDKKFIETASQEFPTDLTAAMSQDSDSSFATNRRDFLKYLGFGVGAATVAASCEIPVKRAIPYVTKPDTIVPGVANYYASSFVKGGDYASILVKTREGRPIKIEGNTMSGVTNGGTSARVQAAVLDLYDTNRIQGPASVKGGALTALAKGWSELDGIVRGKLNAGSAVRIVANSIYSPMTSNAIADFAKKYPNTKVVTYDAVSVSGLLEANRECFGTYAIPDYAFDKADVIVSFGADFLGTWISPIEYAGKYAKGRKVDAANPKMSRHIQVESHMSLTGSNADNRILIKPSEQGAAIATLYNEVVALVGGGAQPVAVPVLNAKPAKGLKKVAAELVAAKGKSLVVSNSNNVNEQILVNYINAQLGNIDETIDFNAANLTHSGNDKDVQALISEMKGGGVGAVIILGANPVFELPNGADFAEGLKKVGLTISTNSIVDETTAACQYAAPMHNFLESWGDANPKNGHYSLIQPTISPIFNTRQAEVSLLSWAGTEGADAYEYLKGVWQNDLFKRQREYSTFQAFWDATLHDGVFTTGGASARQFGIGGNVQNAAAGITKPLGKDTVEISFFETVNLGNGQYAQNPWLQEMPDPVTRTVWTNTLQIPVTYNSDKNKFGTAFGSFEDGDIVAVEIGGKKYECVVVSQFGQPENTVAIALGYGRAQAGTCSGYGTNVNPAIPIVNGTPQYFATAKIGGKVGHDKDFACVQHHHTMGLSNGKKNANGTPFMADEEALAFQGSLVDRTIIRQGTLKDIKALNEKLAEERKEHKHLNDQTLYRGHQDRYLSGLHWSMHVDLNACIGCGACTVACMAENNVPVVGKHEVKRHHEMTWIHISRFYYGDVENPNVVYQPMMCQHCDNAPCENVCPVNATNHSSEGLNQMTYNRCIGTRYCANNCPYKVRRFNWQDYTTADIFPWNERKLTGATLGFSTEMPFGADNLTRMVLNPDVTVRTRGVIEKCSFCVQRIQEGKLTAKKESRQLNDGDVKTACQSSCPTGAITFGNRNDKESNISKAIANTLNYRVLEEVNTDSNVWYGARVANRVEKLDA